jgi:hypothetical protein
MATLRLAKKEESNLCPVHELHSVKGEYHLDRACVEGECMFLTRERLSREALAVISKMAAKVYEDLLLDDYRGSVQGQFGSVTALVLAIQGTAETALRQIEK